MENILSKIKESVAFLKSKGFKDAQIGIVLGTGLGALLKQINILHSIPYIDIPHFPESTVEFHKGQLVFGTINGIKIIVLQGRFHYYEGYSMQEITFPIRVIKELGISSLLLSNAAGGMNINFKKGDLVLIDDHINQLPENPLRGLNDPAFGNRFVDMCAPYNKNLNELIKLCANELSIDLKQGVYVAVPGPNLETRAEYRWLHAMGADMVGMSTVPEVIVANHIGLACAAISVITDECDSNNLQPINIAEIIKVANQADEILSLLFEKVISQLKNNNNHNLK